MARAPFNVLVIPYKKTYSGFYFCIFKREDMNIWQFIAGGGEDDEKPLVAAKRETEEESGINSGEYMTLTSMCHVAANQFSEKAQAAWGRNTIVIPVYTFAVLCDDATSVCISDEHLEYRWCLYNEARDILHFDLDKTALYELNERISHNVIG